MTTKIDVLNEALVACEQPAASSPNDTSTWVVRVNGRYNATVRELLERHPWNFATKRVALQEVVVSGLIGRDIAYNKPGDCLRILRVNATGNARDEGIPDYEDEGGMILTNMRPCYLRYISSDWLTKEGSWPQVFAQAVSLALAAKTYGLFGKSATKKDELKKDARQAFQAAKSWDAAQMPFQALPRGRWATARTGWRYGAPMSGGSSSTSSESSGDVDGDSSGDFDGGEWTP